MQKPSWGSSKRILRSGTSSPRCFATNDWALVEPASETKPGKVRHVRSYPLKPGMAHVYNEGDLHSPRREGPTRLIRIEGKNMDRVKRLAYDKV